MQSARDLVTLTSELRHSPTSSQMRNTYVSNHLTTILSSLSNSSHGNVAKATSVLLPASLTASGDHVTTLSDVTLSSTGSGVKGTPRGGRSTNYGSNKVPIVIVMCVCVIMLIVVLAVVIAILVRYVD